MLSLSSIRRPGYFTEVASGDYYLEGGERPGEWLIVSGTRAQSDGLVEAEALENVLGGWSRDRSRRLTRYHPRRQKGWDLTFSAPKSVSVLYALAPRAIRELIVSAQREAVIVAAKYAVRTAVWSRRGKQGETFEPIDKVVVALFGHITSRAADPAVHTHLLLANASQRLDGTTGALWSREIYQHKMAIGAVYRVELAYQLQQKTGVIIHSVRDWFEIKGIPERLCRHFSKRSREIRSIAREYGVNHPRFLELVTKVTSGVKGHLPHEQLHRQWQQAAKRLGFPVARVLGLVNHHRKELSEKRVHRIAASAASQAIDTLSERHSYFTERQILVAAAPHVMAKGKGADLLFRAVEMATSRLVLLDAPEQRYSHFTTMELYNTEIRIMRMVAGYGKAKGTKPLSFAKLLPLLDKAFKRQQLGTTSPAKRLDIEAAIRHLVGTRDNIRILTGEQGTGKTTALRYTKLALERGGYDVIGCAPTAAAAKDVRMHLGGDVVTVASLLDSIVPSYERRIRHAARNVWRQLRGKKTRKYKENKLPVDERIAHYLKQMQRVLRNKLPRYSGLIRLTKKTAIILDEAQKLSTRDMHDLIKAAQKSGSPMRIAYTLDSPSGDGAAGAIHQMAEQLGVYTMTPSTEREDEQWQIAAHDSLRQGKPKAFFSQYRKEGHLVVSATHDKAIGAVVTRWFKDKTPVKEKLVIATQPDEVKKLNRAIQKRRVQKFAVGRGGVKLHSGDRVATGDRVRFAKSNRFLGVDAGDTGTVVNLTRLIKTPWRAKLRVRVDGKKRFGVLPKFVTVNTRHYKDLALGYACLPAQAQSQSTNVLVLLNPSKINREGVLHQVTRARRKTKLFVVGPDFEPAIDLYLDSLEKKQGKIFAHQFEVEQGKSMQQAVA